jgi:putative transposase
VFRDDVSFARWLVENPDRATASDKELIRDLLTAHSSKELLRMSGVDLEALRSIARSAA